MRKFFRVLAVEDDQAIGKTLKMSLIYKGFDVTICESYQRGFASFQSESFDLVLLDINLPDGNGLDLCRKFRKINPSIPILIITAKTDEASAVKGIEEGADDYIRKPYGVQELAARMNRLMERQRKAAAHLQFGSIRVEVQKRQVWGNEAQLNLGKREFEILLLLVKKSGDVVTRDEILQNLGEDLEIYDRTIDSHLSHLRKKMREANITNIRIVPVYGVGYRLEAVSDGER